MHQLPFSDIYGQFWAGVVGIHNILAPSHVLEVPGDKELIIPYQCILYASGGFRCFDTQKAITICETGVKVVIKVV